MGTHAIDERTFPEATAEITIDPSDTPATIVLPNDGVPTQVANPRRTSWRSFVQAAVSFLLVVNSAALVLLPFVQDPENGLQAALGEVYPYLVGGLNVIVFVGATITKAAALLMANPVVNAWIGEHLPWLAPIRTVEVRGGE